MAHLRIRYLTENLQKLCTFSPIIGVLGHRQVGKTTLLEHFSKDYHTFDIKKNRVDAELNPDQYINSLKGNKTIIDEAQLIPEIFYSLKERVRINKKPGQFILSGSVRFTSKKAIRESLTGRIQYLELLPFSIAEIDHEPLSNQIHKLLDCQDFKIFSEQISTTQKNHLHKMSLIKQYKHCGGLPGVLFLKNEVARNNKIEDQLRTVLDRDLREVYQTTLSFERIEAFCKALSSFQGSSIQYSKLQVETELNPITQQKLLSALESIFMIRRIPIEGGAKGFTIIFEDQAESYYFSKNILSDQAQLTHLLFRNIRTEFFYRYEKNIQFFQYRSRAGVIIPLAIRSNSKTLGFVPIDGEKPTREEKAAGDSFLRSYRDSKIIFFTEKLIIHAIDDRMIVLPISYLV